MGNHNRHGLIVRGEGKMEMESSKLKESVEIRSGFCRRSAKVLQRVQMVERSGYGDHLQRHKAVQLVGDVCVLCVCTLD